MELPVSDLSSVDKNNLVVDISKIDKAYFEEVSSVYTYLRNVGVQDPKLNSLGACTEDKWALMCSYAYEAVPYDVSQLVTEWQSVLKLALGQENAQFSILTADEAKEMLKKNGHIVAALLQFLHSMIWFILHFTKSAPIGFAMPADKESTVPAKFSLNSLLVLRDPLLACELLKLNCPMLNYPSMFRGHAIRFIRANGLLNELITAGFITKANSLEALKAAISPS